MVVWACMGFWCVVLIRFVAISRLISMIIRAVSL